MRDRVIDGILDCMFMVIFTAVAILVTLVVGL